MSDAQGATPEPVENEEILEREKLCREIDELKQAPRRALHQQRFTEFMALATLVTSLIVSSSAYFLSRETQTASDRQHSEERYAKFLEDLGSPNVPARAGAVVGLSEYAGAPKEEHSEETITILITQLEAETDTRVLRVLIPALAHIGPRALDGITKANRYATQRYLSDSRDIVLSALPPARVYAGVYLAAQTDKYGGNSDTTAFAIAIDSARIFFGSLGPQIDAAINLELLDDHERSEMGATMGSTREIVRQKVRPAEWIFFGLTAGPSIDFGINAEEPADFVERLPSLSASELPERLANTAAEARVVFDTGLVLARILRQWGAPRDWDGTGIALIGTDIRRSDLHGAHLRGSYLTGDASGANFESADLTSSGMGALRIWKARFDFATLDGAVLPNANLMGSSPSTSEQIASFRGTDWWDAWPGSTLPWRKWKLGFGVETKIVHGQPEVIQTQLYDCPPQEKMFASAIVLRDYLEHRIAPAPADKFNMAVTYCTTDSVRADVLEQIYPRKQNERLRHDWMRSHKA